MFSLEGVFKSMKFQGVIQHEKMGELVELIPNDERNVFAVLVDEKVLMGRALYLQAVGGNDIRRLNGGDTSAIDSYVEPNPIISNEYTVIDCYPSLLLLSGVMYSFGSGIGDPIQEFIPYSHKGMTISQATALATH